MSVWSCSLEAENIPIGYISKIRSMAEDKSLFLILQRLVDRHLEKY